MNKIRKHTGDELAQKLAILQKLAPEWNWLTVDEVRHSCRIEARDRIREEGFENSFKEGFSEGVEEMTYRCAERMIRDGMDDQAVSGYTDLSPEEVKKIRNGL